MKMMHTQYREISKEMYDRAKQNRDYLTQDDRVKVFNISERCGYGVYSPLVVEKDGKYYVSYYLGSTCD